MSYKDALHRIKEAYRDPQEPDNMRLLVSVYWRSLLLIGLLIVIVSVVWGILLIGEVGSALQQASAQTVRTTPDPFSRTELDSIVAAFTERAATYKALQDAPPAFPDPSK